MPVSYKKILCPVALRECSPEVIKHAASLAKRFSATLYLITVVEEPAWLHLRKDLELDIDALFTTLEERDRIALRDLALKAEELSEAQVETHVLRGKPATEIIKFAEENGIDLIVMGTHTASAIQKIILGSTAEKVINSSKVPVLLIPVK